MGTYRVNREFYTDQVRFEPGESDLDGLSEADKADVVANGWVTPLGDAPEPPVVEVEEVPLALTHFEGAGEPPEGTWERHWQEQAAQPAEASPSPAAQEE